MHSCTTVLQVGKLLRHHEASSSNGELLVMHSQAINSCLPDGKQHALPNMLRKQLRSQVPRAYQPAATAAARPACSSTGGGGATGAVAAPGLATATSSLLSDIKELKKIILPNANTFCSQKRVELFKYTRSVLDKHQTCMPSISGLILVSCRPFVASCCAQPSAMQASHALSCTIIHALQIKAMATHPQLLLPQQQLCCMQIRMSRKHRWSSWPSRQQMAACRLSGT